MKINKVLIQIAITVLGCVALAGCGKKEPETTEKEVTEIYETPVADNNEADNSESNTTEVPETDNNENDNSEVPKNHYKVMYHYADGSEIGGGGMPVYMCHIEDDGVTIEDSGLDYITFTINEKKYYVRRITDKIPTLGKSEDGVYISLYPEDVVPTSMAPKDSTGVPRYTVEKPELGKCYWAGFVGNGLSEIDTYGDAYYCLLPDENGELVCEETPTGTHYYYIEITDKLEFDTATPSGEIDEDILNTIVSHLYLKWMTSNIEQMKLPTLLNN